MPGWPAAPRRYALFLEEDAVPDPTPPTPAPAHPWLKTARTVIAGIITAGVLLPIIVAEAGIDLQSQTWAWLAAVLAVLGAVTRILALPSVNQVLTRVGLGHDDVEAGQVVALMIPEAEHPARVVAGDASPIPTGTSLPASTTVGQLTAGH